MYPARPLSHMMIAAGKLPPVPPMRLTQFIALAVARKRKRPA